MPPAPAAPAAAAVPGAEASEQQQAQQLLPIRRYAADIARAAKEHATVVVIGETGSGKTTQISQILLEAGLADDGGMVAITQPRRVAAVTVARRVAEEMGVELGQEVGYTVRFEDCSGPATRIKYLTDGTLLNECLEDASLSRYSVIVLDEAHERSLSTDILFGVLKQLVKSRAAAAAAAAAADEAPSDADGGAAQQRKGAAGRRRPRPLKLVITSATLDGEKFSAYFDGCPVFHVPGRCFPVDVVHTVEDHTHDYVDAAVDAVLQLHTSQPAPGDILVFLTGQAEIEKALAKLEQGVASLDAGSCAPLLLLPLYASLPPEMQVRVFRPPPAGTRRCIVSTNVAETSVTVDGVVYVVDSGMVKLKTYVAATGMDSLDVVATSRCYRLYTKTFFDRTMPDVTPPEIQRTSLAGAVLQLKCMALDIDVLTFDFLDPPPREALEDALRTLYLLDALDEDGHVTALGRTMSRLPLEPGLARCLLAAQELRCLPEAITVAAMLSTEHVYEHGRGPSDGAHAGGPPGRGGGGGGGRGPSARLRELVAEGLGDHVLLLRLWDEWAGAGCSKEALRELGLDPRGMGFARDVRRQLQGIMSGNRGGGGGRDAGAAATTTGGGDDTGPSGAQREDESRDASSSQRQQRQSQPAGGREERQGGDRERDRHREREGRRSRSRERGGRRGSRSRSRERQAGGGGGAPRGGAQAGRDGGGGRPQQRGGGGAAALEPYAFPSEQHRIAALTQALTIGFAHKLARRLPRHNGYRTLGTGAQIGGGQLAQLHPACATLKEDRDGLLPEWLIYHELVSTSRPFLRQVCTTHFAYVEALLKKIAKVDVQRLSGAAAAAAAAARAASQQLPDQQAQQPAAAAKAGGPQSALVKKDEAAVDAARQRYLQRKAAGATVGVKR